MRYEFKIRYTFIRPTHGTLPLSADRLTENVKIWLHVFVLCGKWATFSCNLTLPQAQKGSPILVNQTSKNKKQRENMQLSPVSYLIFSIHNIHEMENKTKNTVPPLPYTTIIQHTATSINEGDFQLFINEWMVNVPSVWWTWTTCYYV